MYKYKRGINNIDSAKNIEHFLTDNSNICFSMSGCLGSNKPYNGMYIKNGKVLLQNIVEKIEVKDKVYKLTELTTSVQSISCEEYITSIDLNSNTFEYDLGNITYSKKISFKKNSRLLCIDYNIKNSGSSKAKFILLPLLTYRNFFNMKNSQMLRFNQRKDKNGVIVNLSIIDNKNLFLKSNDLKWSKEQLNLTNVKHEYFNGISEKEIFTEDLFIPGEFETSIKANEEKNISLYISCEEFNIDDISSKEIFEESERANNNVVSDIDENFVELKELALAMDKIHLEEGIVSSLPYSKVYNSNSILDLSTNIGISDLEEITRIVKSIDGQYLTFNKIYEAKKVLLTIRRYIKEIEALSFNKEIEFIKSFTLLKLWYIESINRFLQKENENLLYIDFVKETVYWLLNYENKKELYKHIEIVSLTYNAIRIYQSMITNMDEADDIKIIDEMDSIIKLIKEQFWCEDKRVLRRNLNEEDSYASIDMIYTLSLSYPCLLEDIPIKLLDTVFKELYTPYGLRTFSKNSNLNDGLIYPEYMAHFVKANLRQNGVTRASQKIAYNLAKELLLDIGKYVSGGIKKIYHEKGQSIDSLGFDLLTNAEIIRLYDMLT